MSDIVATVENAVKTVEPVVEQAVAPVAAVVETKVQVVEKTLSDLAVEAVHAAEKELEAAKAKAVEIKTSLEAELDKEVERIKSELTKVQAISEVKKIEQAVTSVAKEVVAEEVTAVKSHPVLFNVALAVIVAVVSVVATLLFK
jgi:uncharacterized protein (DUF342 family)